MSTEITKAALADLVDKLLRRILADGDAAPVTAKSEQGGWELAISLRRSKKTTEVPQAEPVATEPYADSTERRVDGPAPTAHATLFPGEIPPVSEATLPIKLSPLHKDIMRVLDMDHPKLGKSIAKALDKKNGGGGGFRERLSQLVRAKLADNDREAKDGYRLTELGEAVRRTFGTDISANVRDVDK